MLGDAFKHMGWWTVSVHEPFQAFDRALVSGDLYGWCNANIGKRGTDYIITERGVIHFQTEEQMVLFLLHWKDRL